MTNLLGHRKGREEHKSISLAQNRSAKTLSVLVAFSIGITIGLPRRCAGQSSDAAPARAVKPINGASQKLPEFEVATIKPVDPNANHMVGVQVYPAGRVIINGVNLKLLLMIAFNLSPWQIEGGDGWTRKDLYNVQAKAPEIPGSAEYDARYALFGIDDERLREMLQQLLIDRFQLKFHRQTGTGTLYLLERSGKPLQLQPAKVTPNNAGPNRDNSSGIGWAEGWVLQNVTIAQLAKFASNYLHRPVLDRTGLTGTFNYRSPHEEPDPQSTEPPDSFVNMIQDLGLKLSPSEGPVESFVIDHAEPPSPN